MRHPFRRFIWGNGFGPRKSPATGASTLHLAQDYGVARGTPILAIHPGVVVDSYRTSAGGWWTILALDNGDTMGVCHSDQRSPIVGRRVAEGTEINKSGNSGTATSGPHAHVTIKSSGVYVDPRAYIDARLGGLSGSPTTPIEENDDMPLTPKDVSLILNSTSYDGGPTVSVMFARLDAVHAAIFEGGTSMDDNGRSISASLGGIVKVVDILRANAPR